MIPLFSYFTIPLRWPTTIRADMSLQQVPRFLTYNAFLPEKRKQVKKHSNEGRLAGWPFTVFRPQGNVKVQGMGIFFFGLCPHIV